MSDLGYSLALQKSQTLGIIYTLDATDGATNLTNTVELRPWLNDEERTTGGTSIPGVFSISGPCYSTSRDAAAKFSDAGDPMAFDRRSDLEVGSTLVWTYKFTTSSSSRARLGLAIYDRGEERYVPGGVLEVVQEIDGNNYCLKTVSSASVWRGAEISVPTPANRRFYLRYGGAKVGSGARFRLEGIGSGANSVWPNQSGYPFAGTGVTDIQPYGQIMKPRPAGTVTLRVMVSKPTPGAMFLALYEEDQ